MLFVYVGQAVGADANVWYCCCDAGGSSYGAVFLWRRLVSALHLRSEFCDDKVC